ncbi:hypothetical protein P4S63_21255 [Pseudoalteromonas sp. B193]
MRYGAVRGSYQANWFKTQNIIAEVEVNSLEEIVNVMHHKRIDRILLDLDDFELAASKLGINKDEYQKEFLDMYLWDYLLRIHFSNAFLNL